MTEKEVNTIISTIICTYPHWKPEVDMKFLKKTWYTLLADMDYKTVSNNLTHYIQSNTSGFAPSIGTLRQGAAEYPTELEAWSIVRKAIGNSGYNYNEEFSKLPIPIRKAVGSPNNLYHWSQMDAETLGSVEQSHFISVYRSVVIQMKNDNAVRQDLRSNMQIPEAPKKEEPLLIEGEAKSVDLAKYEELIQRIKDGTYRRDSSRDDISVHFQ